MIGKLTELLVFGFAPLLLGMLSVPEMAAAEEKSITGEVSYRERIALPPHAVLTVQLVDVSLADAPSTIIGQQKIDPAGQVPIKFSVPFDPVAIQPQLSYALQARITVDDRLWFINDVRHDVDPLTAGPQNMMLIKVSQNETPTGDIFDREWVAEEIGGAAVLDEPVSTLRIATDGKVTGRGACNNFFGSATATAGTIKFGQMGSTQMACEPSVMDQERKFHDALENAATYRIDNGKLILVDKDGKDIVLFGDGG
ncbi:YbaY family lipoprotein [Mesorhizobium sp. ANAO-SY3R2]|uniref:YbaY family lipoprotein n=1 Tax=Mesorhizobium sp. ANAO-SY3R2 TaxID=3166644 RepID=UPI00366D521F